MDNQMPISPEPSAVVPPAVPTLTTEDVIAETMNEEITMDTFAELNDTTTTGLLDATQNSFAAFTRNNTMVSSNISLEKLFGKGYAAILNSENPQVAHDPALLDTDAILYDTFGAQTSFVHDAFTTAANAMATRYAKAIADAKIADRMSELDENFGPQVEYVKEDAGVCIRPNVTMSAAFPVKSGTPADSEAALYDSTLLLTMPTVHPNRQVLHFDSVPYNPMTSRPKESTDRKTYTPQNIMLWTYEPKTKQFLSNTRVIQWSDGTTTLHVGAEAFDIETYTDGALSFLGERRHMYRYDKAYSAIIETVPVDNHITVRSRTDRNHAMDVVEKRTTKAAENAALAIGLPMTGLPAFVGDGGRKSVEEEYVDSERTALKKLIAEMERNGTPMSRAEQMRRDAQILIDVINIGKGIDSLVAQQNARKRQEEAEKEAARAERELANSSAKVGGKRVRLPGGVDGVEKRSRTERKTDRQPAVNNGMDAEEEAEAIVARAEAVELTEDNWRDVVCDMLGRLRDNALDDGIKVMAGGTIDAVGILSKTGAIAELRNFLEDPQIAEDLSVADNVNELTTIVERLDGAGEE